MVLDGASNRCPVLEHVGFGDHLEYIGLKSSSDSSEKQFYNPDNNMKIATCPGIDRVGNEYLRN